MLLDDEPGHGAFTGHTVGLGRPVGIALAAVLAEPVVSSHAAAYPNEPAASPSAGASLLDA